jgi:uncharacterized membrane protein YphA (DoxX/SURF4 family)
LTKTSVKTWIKDGYGVVARIALAVTFVWACVHKIAEPYDFGMQVATYQILPLSLVNLQAIVLPWVELVVGLLLIAGLLTRPAALVTCGLNLMFIVAISMALAADLHLQCGCFSSAEAGEEMDVTLIVRDAIFFVVGAAVVVMRPDRFTLDRLIERRRQNA